MRASGKAKNIATIATDSVPTSTAEMPMTSWSGCHSLSVKKLSP